MFFLYMNGLEEGFETVMTLDKGDDTRHHYFGHVPNVLH